MAARKHRLGGLDSQYSREWRINGLMRNGFTRAHAEAVEEKQAAKRIVRTLGIVTVREPPPLDSLHGVDAMVHYGRLACERNR